MNNLAPIILFVYNRPNHTKRVINALKLNPLASQSKLFIFSDGPKDKNTENKVQAVREYIKTINGFKEITIFEKNENIGLAESIINGVTKIINKYQKAIILEDDIEVTPIFLEYMNFALNKYCDHPKVWSISAWNYPVMLPNISEDTFFWRIPHCWGWATWSNRWQYFKRDIKWVEQNFSKQDIYEISLHNSSEYWNHFVLNKKGRIKTWAIFWYLTAYKHKALTLMPKTSIIKQIGLDSSGSHCTSDDPLASDIVATTIPKTFPRDVIENNDALNEIIKFHKKYKRNIFKRIISKIRRLMS